MRKLLTGFILSLTLLLSVGCSPKLVSIEVTAQGVRATSLGLAVLEDIAIELHHAGILDRSTAEVIMDFSFHANMVGLEASRFISTLKGVSLDDRKKLRNIIAPILDSLDALIADKVIYVKNPGTMERIETALFMVRLALQSMGDL